MAAVWWWANFKVSIQSGQMLSNEPLARATSSCFSTVLSLFELDWALHTHKWYSPSAFGLRESSLNNHWEEGMPLSLSRGQTPPCMLTTRQCLPRWASLQPSQVFLRPAELPTTDTCVAGKVECGVFLPQTPASRSTRLHLILCHLLCPSAPGGFLPGLVTVGEVSQQLSERAATEDTQAHGLRHVRTRTHAHGFPSETPPRPATRPAELLPSWLCQPFPQDTFRCGSKHLPGFLILGLLRCGETPPPPRKFPCLC